jgi:hypothetical protein
MNAFLDVSNRRITPCGCRSPRQSPEKCMAFDPHKSAGAC